MTTMDFALLSEAMEEDTRIGISDDCLIIICGPLPDYLLDEIRSLMEQARSEASTLN